MRTRTIMTVAILAVGGGTGCTRQAPATRTVAVAPTPAATPAVATTVTAVPAPVIAVSAPRPADDSMNLFQLADELRATEPALVAARTAHFRPLCDGDGYPVVGNLVTKSMQPDPPVVAAFCADVRAQGPR